jgi:hypothetical protein
MIHPFPDEHNKHSITKRYKKEVCSFITVWF